MRGHKEIARYHAGRAAYHRHERDKVEATDAWKYKSHPGYKDAVNDAEFHEKARHAHAQLSELYNYHPSAERVSAEDKGGMG